jgi:hypothetical protein
VQGLRTDMAAFSARFAMLGFETIGGWLALAVALLLLVEWVGRSRPTLGRAAGIALVAVVATASWAALRYVPVHTWVPWIPAEVQQDYGTEYASIVFSPTATPLQVAALAAAAAAAALFVWYAIGARGARGSSADSKEGGSQ